MLFVALIGGLLDFFITYGFLVLVFLVVHFLFVRSLNLQARYRRVHPYAFYLSLATVIYNVSQTLSRLSR
ncbi:MAG: hypothetical protein ACOX9B_12175 [Candidatus Xenobium sp.]|jgi:hypothetical protein|nr:hypothetical protein [Burkholderiales bacterium]